MDYSNVATIESRKDNGRQYLVSICGTSSNNNKYRKHWRDAGEHLKNYGCSVKVLNG